MTHAEDKLAAFFASQEPSAIDVKFLASALEAFKRRQARKDWLLVGLVGVVTALVAVLVGDRLAISVNVLVPALMPVAVVGAALSATGRLPGARPQW